MLLVNQWKYVQHKIRACVASQQNQVCVQALKLVKEQFPEHLQDVLDRGSVHLTETEKELLKQKLAQYADVISSKYETLGCTNVTRHKIDIRH